MCHCNSTNGSESCNVCVDYTRCESCDNMVDNTSTVIYPRCTQKEICQSCIDDDCFTCEICDDIHHNTYPFVQIDSCTRVCKDCYENHYFECSQCGEHCHVRNRDGNICITCYEENNSSDDVFEYGYKPDPEFFGKGPYYMGVELEVISSESLQDSASYVVRKLGDFAYLKEDGSLSSGGFEIVTHPATLEEHKIRWEPLLNNLSYAGIESYNHRCCGLHIHASRENLSELTIAKILVFINSINNRNFIVALAQRESSYAEISEKKFTDVFKQEYRREALNLMNSDTIEFRLFKGNLKKEALYRALEFVECIQLYCMQASLNDMIITQRFFDYAEKYKKRYPNLFSFINKFTSYGEINDGD